ncbi:glycosidase [Mobilisporobacter senegalensis]|uniref:Glycosidase n=1 Tax=Mobilisporobacter senegalensis TaxID=1329262 RepID=A0A3N1XG70_9FIRM|nr:alpha-amylase family glycosyl hydrolase [Mobilisporobacter senegalensis]ROR25719.1 glycosidase [Mobilisporobacter senegalensis]
MQKLLRQKKVISWLLFIAILVTLLPGNLVARAEDVNAGGAAFRKITDIVEAYIGEDKVPLNLYSNGIYETKINVATGSAIEVYVNGIKEGTTSWIFNGDTELYIRYDSDTGEISNSVSDPELYKQSATWVGNFTGLDVGISNWAPADMSGDLDYMGGGIFSKTFYFTQTTSAITLADGGYKVAYNHNWGNGEVSDNISLTIPSGSDHITIFADSIKGDITDSFMDPDINKIVSVIGTIRESEDINWDPTLSGYEMRRISKDYYTYSKVFQIPGSYEYKCSFNHQNEWPSWNNKVLDIENANTNVIFLYNIEKDCIYDSVNDYNTVASVFGFSQSGEEEQTDSFISQPGGNSIWRVTGGLGSYDNWDINNSKTVMAHLVGEFYAKSMVLDGGTYEFKFTKNGSWDNAIGSDGISNNAANIKLELEERTTVNFYLNDELEGQDKVRVSIGGLEVQGIKQYVPALNIEEHPRLVGNLQTVLGESNDWSPGTSKLMFIDYYFNNTVYKLQRTLPLGNYQCKVVFGDSWNGSEIGDPAGPDGNLELKILDASGNVTFTIDNSAERKVLTHNYKPVDSNYDGTIDKTSLYYDSRSITYKKPFGAIKQESEDVTFRFAAKTSDAQLVKLELINNDGISRSYDMAVTTVLDDKDYWEVMVPKEVFKEIGIWSYKFIIIDGAAKLEYGDDGSSGGIGGASEDGQTPYNLTVYAKDYKTPDWMKNGIVYQIFPDRFFDGDASNNHAKDVDGSRGDGIQLFDGDKWSTIPENPRQSEEANKPYYPDATTDGVWSNEFYGGDIAGIEQKLSYLKTLGISAIYLNPVSWAASNHKYDATDYKHLDPMFGKPVYNISGDPGSGLNYEATKEASDKIYSDFAKACKNQGIYLISDGVFNHVGDDSIYFDRYEKYPEIGAYEYWSRVWDEAATSKVSQTEAEKIVKDYYKSLINPGTGKNYTDSDFAYIDWFQVGPDKVTDETGVTRYNYEGWWGYDSLPVVSTVLAEETKLTNDSKATIAGEHEYNNIDYRENVIGYDLNQSNITDITGAMKKANSQRWLWMGADGWRLDVAPDVSNETWKEFRKSVKSATGKADINGDRIEDPIILGEEWNVATQYLLGDMFDSVMNYQFRSAIQNFIVNNGNGSDLNNALEIIRENYPKEAWQAMLNLVDSHDTVRNITKIDNPTWEEENIKIAPEPSEKAIKLQALTAIFQMSYPGAPTIYYGDEVGVAGTKDPDSRRTFPWERVEEKSDGNYNISDAYEEKYGDLLDTYINAAKVRNQHLELFATGDIKTAYADGDVIAYARKSDTEGGLSIINKLDKSVDIVADVKDFLPDGLILEDQLGTGIRATVTNGTLRIQVPGYTGMMMVSTTKLTTLPPAPKNLTATGTEGKEAKVILTWDPVEGAGGYYIYRTLLEGMETVQLNSAPVTDTTFTDDNVVHGTRYYYYVKTVKENALSMYSNTATALPCFKITEIGMPTGVTIDTIGVGKKTTNTDVTIIIPGLTDREEYTGKEVPGLIFHLAYYLEGTSKDRALETKLRYKEDSDGGKVYTAAFEPTKEGVYRYFGKATVNNGYTFILSQEASMNATADYSLPVPETPDLKQPIQESSRVTLNWVVESNENIAGFDIYRAIENLTGSEEKIGTVDKDIESYTDFMVNNDVTYTYRIEAFNKEYNRKSSEIIRITPKLTMIDVTIRLTIPDKVFTSATDNIYLAGDVNGWNASGWLLKKPSGATDSNIVEYSFKMMAGKKIQYKYTRGTWATEALTSNIPNDTTSPGNYGYSSTDTNIHATITNQGGNKMLINDYVLRWVDMPIMITVPRISYKGETIEYSTTEDSFHLQASVPFGGIFTINGKNINLISPGALDSYGNVRLNNIPLVKGINEFEIHIEPTDETKALPWLTDTGRITSQMSATTMIRITKTTDTPSNPIPPTTPVSPSDNNGISDPKVKEPQFAGENGVTGWNGIVSKLKNIIVDKGEKSEGLKFTIDMNSTTLLPKEILETIKGKDVEISLNMGDYVWTISGKNIKDNIAFEENYNLKVSSITNIKEKSQITKAINDAKRNNKVANKKIQIQQFAIENYREFPFSADLTLKLENKYNNRYVYLNYYNEKTKKIELYGYGKADKYGYVTLSLEHSSAYVLTSENPILPSVIKTKTLKAGKNYTLKVNNALNKAGITYSSGNPSVAAVSKKGYVKTKKKGTAIIKIKVVQAGKTYLYQTKITVK